MTPKIPYRKITIKNPLNFIIYGNIILSDNTDIIKIVISKTSYKGHSSFSNSNYFIDNKTRWNYYLIPNEYNNNKYWKKKFRNKLWKKNWYIICLDKLEDETSNKSNYEQV